MSSYQTASHSSFDGGISTTYSDGTVVIEMDLPDNRRLLRATTPGRETISLFVEPYTDLSRSVQERTAAAVELARKAGAL